jgi:subtilase family serine protease
MPRTPVCSFHKCAAIAAFLLAALSASAQLRNRITQRIEDTEPAVVMGAHPLARPEFDRGRVDGSMRIRRAAMVFRLAPDQQSALEKLLADQQNPDSPNYQKWLTPEQYAARFGMSDSDLAKVSAWLKSQGLTVNGLSRARTRVFFSGTAAQVESAFRTELHQFEVNGEMRFANATEVSVPAALSGMVRDFRGLDNFRPQPRAHAVKPNFTSHISGNHFLTPGDFATIYNLSPLYSAGFDGTGQKIAVVGQTQIHTADIDAFRTAAGLPAKNLQLVDIDNSTGFSSGDEVEADLDVEWSGGVAKNATILFVFAGSTSSKNVFDAFAFAIDNNLAPVMSTSYGNCEAALGTFAQTLRQDVQQANSQGQTVTAASGDSGAADCDSASSKSATHGLAVDSPASVPEVTGIGGTEFTGDTAGTVTGSDAGADLPYWGGTTGGSDNISSALIYIPEMAWNDTTASIAAGFGLSASGGGASTAFAKPSWQTALTPADAHRDVPDVSLAASPNHDGSLVCSQAATGSGATSCVSGFRDSAQNLSPVGGTSVGAPAFAGIIAILNQAAPSAGGGLGNINPKLYALAVSTPAAFHDITTGNNIVPCTSGSTGCPASAPFQIGLSAGTGYDMVTGLGSIDAHALVTSWPGFVATPDFSVGGTPISVSVPGQSGTSTITVSATNGFSGTVTLACSGLPSGATCAFAPASVSSSGRSTLTITTTTATPVATSNITVTGTSGVLSHSTSVSLTVNAPTTPDFTISAAPSNASVPAGSSVNSTITVTAVGGFASAVNLACAVAGGGTPAPTCSLSTATLANGSGTPTLTVSTTAPHSLSGAVIAPHGLVWLAASSTLLAGVLFLGVPSSRRRRVAGLGLMLLVFFAAGLGCGGGSSTGNGSAQTGGGTPSGTYTITVTATSTSPALSHNTIMIVTVP